MEYKLFGNTGVSVSRIGFGTNRFSPTELNSYERLTEATRVLREAIEKHGVNYVDVAHTYSGGYAQKIVAMLPETLKKQCHFSVKASISSGDISAEATIRRIQSSISCMGINHAKFGFLWAVRSISEYKMAVEHGGVYDGLMQAKKGGLISHLCISLHTSPEESIQIIKEGLFEGVTLSCHVLNLPWMQPVLDAAKEMNIGVFTMNSLAGGLLLRYPQIINRLPSGFSIAQASLAQLMLHDAVSCCLCGMNEIQQLEENIQTVELLKTRQEIKWKHTIDIHQDFCTGCGYCMDCPQEIPIVALMQGYNSYLIRDFQPKYNVQEKSKLADIYAFEMVKRNIKALPEKSNSPCIKCGQCENRCTQKLNIIERIAYMYHRVDKCSFSLQAWRDRFEECLPTTKILQSGVKVYFYPAGLYTKNVIRLYRQLIGDIKFEIHVFDRNKELTQTELIDGILVEPVEAMENNENVLCLITNYAHENDIFAELSQRLSKAQVVKLHRPEDVPWLYLYW